MRKRLNPAFLLRPFTALRMLAAGPRHLRTGLWGERVAETCLKRKGYRTVGRRVRVGRRDEIDLIMRSPEGVMVFAEVKTRADERFGRPAASVGRRKRTSLTRAALRYLEKLPRRPDYFRFDIVEVVGSDEQSEPVVRHIENAFTAGRNQRVNW